MMKTALLNMHYTAEEAHQLLQLLDELRDSLWNNYHEQIIEYCSQAEAQENADVDDTFEDEDDVIPF